MKRLLISLSAICFLAGALLLTATVAFATTPDPNDPFPGDCPIQEY